MNYKHFLLAGAYTFKLFAAPPNGDDTSSRCVFTYMINVLDANPSWVPFPKMQPAWGAGCSIEGLGGGHLEAGQTQQLKVVAPGAEKMMVVTDGNQETQLEKVTTSYHFIEME